jgi:hypothetical protein
MSHIAFSQTPESTKKSTEAIDPEVLNLIKQYKDARTSSEANELKTTIIEIANQAYPDRLDEIKNLIEVNKNLTIDNSNKADEIAKSAMKNTQNEISSLSSSSSKTNYSKIEPGVYDTKLYNYPISIKYSDNGNIIYKDFRETVEYKKTSETRYINIKYPSVYIELIGEDKIINGEDGGPFRRELTLYAPRNAKPANDVMTFTVDDDTYFARSSSHALFVGTYEEKHGSIRYGKCNNLVQLNADQSGIIQSETCKSTPITWWIETDYLGNFQRNGNAFYLVYKDNNTGIFERTYLYVKPNENVVKIWDRVKNCQDCSPPNEAIRVKPVSNEPKKAVLPSKVNPTNEVPFCLGDLKSVSGLIGPQGFGLITILRDSLKNSSVVSYAVPGYVKGKSIPLAKHCFQGSYSGVHIAFYSNLGTGLTNSSYNVSPGVSTTVAKLHGQDWTSNTDDRVILAYDAVKAVNELPAELTFYWAGNLKGSTEEKKIITDCKYIASQKVGIYTKNNKGNVPSTASLECGRFFQIASAPGFVPEDRNYHPQLYGIGGKCDVDDSKLYLWTESKLNTEGYLPSEINIEKADLGNLIMVASDYDNYVWIGAGQKIENTSSNSKKIDLSQYGAKGTIRKMIASDRKLWVLCGGQIFKIEDNTVTKFYDAGYPLGSFAADNSHLYTSNGFKISTSLKKITPLFGAKPTNESQRNDYKSAMTELPNCFMETTLDPTDGYLYLFSPASGKVYTVNK